MSKEQYDANYANNKIVVQGQPVKEQPEPTMQSPKLLGGLDPQLGIGGKMFHLSPPGSRKQNSATSPDNHNLNGIVNIKAYDRMYTNEVPATACNLNATQLDHLKVLSCDPENRDHPKLTQ
jgi:hypothetical protein